MKIAVMGDLHITERPAPGAPSLSEQRALLKRYADNIGDAGADMAVIAGDIFDGRSTPAERKIAMWFVNYLYECVGKVNIIKGNHDQVDDLLCLANPDRNIYIKEEPSLDDGILSIPWIPGKENVLATLDSFSGGKIELVFGHIEIAEVLAGGQLLSSLSRHAISVYDLEELGAKRYVLGHIHSRQRLSERTQYCGSIRPTAFGHGSDDHGYLLLSKKGDDWLVSFREIECPKMITVHLEPDMNIADGKIRNGDSIRVARKAPKSEYARASAEIDHYIDKLSKIHSSLKVVKDLQVIPEQRSRIEPAELERYNMSTLSESIGDLAEKWWEQSARPDNGDKVVELLRRFVSEAT